MKNSYKGAKLRFSITVCKKENINDKIMFVDGDLGSDSEEEIIKVPENNENGPKEASQEGDKGSMGDFSVESDLGIDTEGIFVPQKGINMPTSDRNLANPSKMKIQNKDKDS